MAAAKAKPFLLSAKELAASLSMPKTNFSLRPDHEKIQDEFRRALSVNLYRWQVKLLLFAS